MARIRGDTTVHSIHYPSCQQPTTTWHAKPNTDTDTPYCSVISLISNDFTAITLLHDHPAAYIHHAGCSPQPELVATPSCRKHTKTLQLSRSASSPSPSASPTGAEGACEEGTTRVAAKTACTTPSCVTTSHWSRYSRRTLSTLAPCHSALKAAMSRLLVCSLCFKPAPNYDRTASRASGC